MNKLCYWHKKSPNTNKQKHGLWVTYCNETNCELTGVYETKEEAMAAWDRMMDGIEVNTDNSSCEE